MSKSVTIPHADAPVLPISQDGLWSYDGTRETSWLSHEELDPGTVTMPGQSAAMIEEGGLSTVSSIGSRVPVQINDEKTQTVVDRWQRRYGRVWRYWITTPDAQLPGVRDFVAAAEADDLPEAWTEKAAEDGTGEPFTLCTFRLTMDGARSLGAEQSALMTLADLPEGVFFFQTVASIEGFTGVERESRQPTTLDSALYEPSNLFQTSHPDAAGQRGSAFGESDVLDVTGLTLT
jgi:hypothetical protein